MPRSLLLSIVLALATSGELAAQTDYRNLDAGRPLLTEDAYALERGAYELSFGYEPLLAGGAPGTYLLEPELAFGFDNAQFSLAWPVADSRDDPASTLGPRAGLLYNLFTQPRRWPALAFRLDGALIADRSGGRDLRLGGKLLATRSFGATRMHLNAGFTAGPEDPYYSLEYPGRAALTVGLDRSLWRRSLMLGVEGGATQRFAGEDPAWVAGAGVRWQWSPTLVLDAGYREVHEPAAATERSIQFGVTQVWGRGRPSHRKGPARVPMFERRDEQFYAPGEFNWAFLRREPDAARLFNAFDYGHAVLYERLLTRRGAALDSSLAEAYRFLTTDLLVRPPRYAVAEEAVMPAYASEYWRAKQVFEWAHLLHRQIYDVYSASRHRPSAISPSQADSLIEVLTDRYLERREYALAPVPKVMSLMEGQPYSGAFARQEPQFNGLIWAYHWLQVGLYEPFARRAAGGQDPPPFALDPVIERFRQMLATERFPAVMPMTSAVAPTFTAAHPRAAAIFDNLHALHDVISDILLNDAVVPPAGKRGAVWGALAKYQDATTEVEADEHWRMMGEMVGGVERMGGAVP